jgi:hypothetical protein
MYYDREGHLTVALTRGASTVAAVARFGTGTVVVEADHTFAELASWRARLRPLLAIEGVVSLDVDERRNRVRIGVDPREAKRISGALQKRLAFELVPAGAVVITAADPIRPVVTLRDQVRPTVGGLQINFSNFLCTLGFNAVRAGTFGFVTNSHCTDRQGGVEDTRYFQPLSPAAVATEIADPTYQRNIPGCPRGRRCRFSDSSFADYDSDSLGSLGHIARTTARDNLNGSITIDDANPTFAVNATAAAVAGQDINKIGRTTGWTHGIVDQTCTDVGVSGTNIVLLCQDLVNAGVGGGDSGSPVFTWNGGSTVTLNGILWGGNSAGTLFVYSPFANIQGELGALNVF